MTTTVPEGVTIRRAERADLLGVVRIERASFPQPWPFQAFLGFLGEPGFLVAVPEGQATGGGEGRRGRTNTPRREEVPEGQATGGGEGAEPAGTGGGGGTGDERGGGEEVCGYVVADVVTDYGRTVGHVKDLAVAPDWRGRGVGSQLLERALSVLVAGGARRAKLEVRAGNEAALGLYGRFGFTPDRVVPAYYDDGEDALLLTADLTELDSPGRDDGR